MAHLTFRYLHWYMEIFGEMHLRDMMSLDNREACLSIGAYLAWRTAR